MEYRIKHHRQDTLQSRNGKFSMANSKSSKIAGDRIGQSIQIHFLTLAIAMSPSFMGVRFGSNFYDHGSLRTSNWTQPQQRGVDVTTNVIIFASISSYCYCFYLFRLAYGGDICRVSDDYGIGEGRLLNVHILYHVACCILASPTLQFYCIKCYSIWPTFVFVSVKWRPTVYLQRNLIGKHITDQETGREISPSVFVKNGIPNFVHH